VTASTANASESFECRFKMDDGVEIVADVGGPEDAPVVVFMHGGGQTRHSWAGAFAAVLDAGYRAINYDARGHGASGWSPNGIYSPARRTADLAAILGGTKRPVALVGASMGGMTALRAVSEGKVPQAAIIVLVDIVPRPNPAGTARIMQFMRSHLDGFASLEEAADAVASYNPHRPRPRDPSGLARNLRLRDGRYYWHWDPRILKNIPTIEPGGSELTMLECASRIRIPTLLVRGLQSDVVTDESVREFQAILPGLEIFDVAGAGHMVVGDSNAVFNAGILKFLGRQLPVGGAPPG